MESPRPPCSSSHPSFDSKSMQKPSRWRKRRRRSAYFYCGSVASLGLVGVSAYLALSAWLEGAPRVEDRTLSKFSFKESGGSGRTSRLAVTDSPPRRTRSAVEDTSLSFTVNSKGYDPLKSTDPRILGYPWEHVVEPYRETIFSAVNTTTTSRGFEDTFYLWQLTWLDGSVQEFEGNPIIVTFTEPTEKTAVVLKEVGSAGEVVRTYESEVMCKYVRREIRQLTDDDLMLFLDRLRVLWDVKTEDGWEMYGPGYKGIDYFNMKHINYGADPECNHFHEGPGFITQHLALTMEFEMSLQTVEPSLTVPYWDFTLDAALYGPEWSWMSPVLADDILGPALSPTYIVDRGRWAYLPLGDFGSYFDKTPIHNSYGLLRPPWNNNPYPFLTRWHNVAATNRTDDVPNDCLDYWETLHDTTWGELALDANTKAHGNLHSLLGGSWWEYKDWYGEGMILPAGSSVTYIKYFWRAGYFKCPIYCAPYSPRVECQCHCDFGDDDWATVIANVQALMDETILNTAIPKLYSKAVIPESFDGDLDDYVRWLVETTVCDSPSVGDNLDSESTHDPTFWPMHPTFGRLMQWMRLSDEPYSFNWGVLNFTCPGHNPWDEIPFSGLFRGDDPDVQYTNLEMYEKLDPTNELMPYIYADFEWQHCEDLGFDMSNQRLGTNKAKRQGWRTPQERNEMFSHINWDEMWATGLNGKQTRS